MQDLTDVLSKTQGNTLSGFGGYLPVGRFFLLHFSGAAGARSWLHEIQGDIHSDLKWRNPEPDWALNIAFTYAGLARCEVPGQLLAQLPKALKEGMWRRAKEQLGDRGENVPAKWERHWDPKHAMPLHALLAVYARDEDCLERRINALPSGGDAVHVIDFEEVGFPKNKKGKPELREHFGFLDGAGQPDIEGLAQAYGKNGTRSVRPRASELGTWDNAHLEWRPLKPGEFVFGVENEGGGVAPMPRDRDRDRDRDRARKKLREFEQYQAFMENGSFMVYRKLQQFVGTFRNFLTERARTTGLSGEELAARLVGRWPNSAPLADYPKKEDADQLLREVDQPGASRARLNAFRYQTEEQQKRVPLGAHVRRANPRDSLPGDRTDVKRRRMLRRGIPYGARYVPWGDPPPTSDEGDEERGLIFISLQTNIAGQFEAVQREWLNDGDVFGQGRDRDPVTGGEEGRMIIPDAKNPVVQIPALVKVRGGAYFFKPSLPTLAIMAEGGSASAYERLRKNESPL